MSHVPTIPFLRQGLAALLVLAGTSAASAQAVIGPVPWQMQPYCNIVTLTLVSTPAGFTLDGTDDQCGAANKASAVGIASPNASGNFTLNFTIVTATSAKPVHVSAVVSPADGNGTWTDSAGNAGTFAFLGATPGLPARPLPSSGLAPSVITTVEIAAGAVGATDINTAEVQARVTGTCGAGTAMSAVLANGGVTCVPTSTDVRFRAATLASQSISGSSTLINGWATLTNVGGGTYDATTGEYTVPSTGTYMVTATVGLNSNSGASGNRCVLVYINNQVEVGECAGPSASLESQSAATVISLTAGDTVGIRVQNNTGAASTTTDAAVAGFYIARVH
jgi:hypothetical protein